MKRAYPDLHRTGAEVGINWLDKKKPKKKLKQLKSMNRSLKKKQNEINAKIQTVKFDPSPVVTEEQRAEKIHLLKKEKKSLQKQVKKNGRRMRKTKEYLRQLDERVDYGFTVDRMVNSDGLFRTSDDRYICNGLFHRSIAYVGMMLNHMNPNWRKIAAMVENIIGNLSLCMCNPNTIDLKMIEILTKYILKIRKILEVINPTAVVLYAKFLILSGLDDTSIVYDCDQILHSQKFSNAYRKLSEGKYAFDQYVEFAKFQNPYMTQDQRWIYSQYQKIIRVMEDNGMITCESGRLKQRTRNFIRDMGIRRDQVGELIHYSYDKALDAADKYYAEKDPNMRPMFEYARDISNFSPRYAGEMYAMGSF